MENHEPRRILLTGATGYLGGRLLPALQARGMAVRAMARKPEFASSRISDGVEVVAGDVLDPASLESALDGIDTAYYLVHSMGSTGDFEEIDRRGAENFASAARRAGVRRLIYVGGLGSTDDLSSHLKSRQEVGRILANSGVPTIEFRASIIIGSGSLSFEMIRSLVGRLPVMLTPKWVSTQAQPIAVEDVIDYLVEALDIPLEGNEVFEIGGEDQASYRDILEEYAKQVGLKRRFLSVPVLTPGLSALWLGLVTPLYARVGRKLIDSLRNETTVQDQRALSVFTVRPRGLSASIARALVNEDQRFAETRWSDALSSSGGRPSWGGTKFGSRLIDSRVAETPAAPAEAFAPIRTIGGDVGWYFGTWLWRLRGLLDLAAGGPGLRRGRRDPEHSAVGDALDFWRVEAYEPNRRLRLRAEMKVPGRAWLEFEVAPFGRGSKIRQTAEFDPRGLFGLAYWYALYPLHELVFAGMLREITRRSCACCIEAPPVAKAAAPNKP